MIKATLFTLLTLTLFSLSMQADNNQSNNKQETNMTVFPSSLIEVYTDNCVGCHGFYFEKHAMGLSKIVKELTPEYIEATLFNYKYESNDGNMDALMAFQTSKLSDDEIKAIAQKIGKKQTSKEHNNTVEVNGTK